VEAKQRQTAVEESLRPLGILLVAAIALGLTGCASKPKQDELRVSDLFVLTQGIQSFQAAEKTDFDSEDENAIGREAAARILATRRVHHNDTATDYLNLLGYALSLYSDRPETFGGYHFLILDSDEVNGYACPGGIILVCRGLLRCAGSEDQVAAILSQLISHIVLKDGLEALKQFRKARALSSLALAVAKTEKSSGDDASLQTFAQNKDLIAKIEISHYSREATFEADKMSTVIMRRIGYNPGALVDLLTTMKSRMDPMLKPNPTADERISALEKVLAGQPEVAPNPEAVRARQERFIDALGKI